MGLPTGVVLSCEHAGNEVPERYSSYFVSPAAKEALSGHRGWDPGSLPIGDAMSEVLGAPLVVQSVTRLLVECNRSLDHPRLFSEFSRRMPAEERDDLVRRYWRAHRESVTGLVADAGSRVVHVGIHTFTPVWKGRDRPTDVGLLYDPARPGEGRLVRAWRKAMVSAAWKGPRPSGDLAARRPLRIHLNRPYRGWTDGLTTALRRELPEGRYLGVELEVSQRLAASSAPELGRWLAQALEEALPVLR